MKALLTRNGNIIIQYPPDEPPDKRRNAPPGASRKSTPLKIFGGITMHIKTSSKQSRKSRERREAQNFGFYDGEYMETMEESVYRYAPHQRYEKAVSYLEQYLGLPKNYKDDSDKKGVLVMSFTDGREFKFDNLEEVSYYFPLGHPKEHSMVIVNSQGTLFAYGNGQAEFVQGYKIFVGNKPYLTKKAHCSVSSDGESDL
jgi:hypothetical protein